MVSMDFNISYAMSGLPATWKSQGILKLFQDQYKRLIIFQDGQGKFEITVELQWLEHLWDHENEFETGVVRANEG